MRQISEEILSLDFFWKCCKHLGKQENLTNYIFGGFEVLLPTINGSVFVCMIQIQCLYW